MIHELKSVRDVWRRLPSEDHARRFLEELIWGEDRFCPHCGCLDSIPLRGKSSRPGLYHCRDCRGQFTVTTRTPMHATKLELRVWIAAIFLVLTSSKGISSVVMGRLLGITQKSAWKLGHAIREMMDARGETGRKLAGIVEVDEAFVGGAPKFKKGKKNKRGRGTSKPEVLVAVSREGGARATVMRSTAGAPVRKVLEHWIEPASTLMTDGNSIYTAIGQGFADHQTVNHSRKNYADKATGAHINTAEALISQVQRALVGVYHRLPPQHLQRYLNEIAWRWNKRESTMRLNAGTGQSHMIWRAIPVLDQMRALFRNAPGREMRRSGNFGITWPDRALATLAVGGVQA